VDISPKGGYGVLYGPNIDVNGVQHAWPGKIAGTEYLAYADDGTGKKNVTLMVQVPANFGNPPNPPCIVTAAVVGLARCLPARSETAGEWGLKHGCAVAYADKGTGNRRPRSRDEHRQSSRMEREPMPPRRGRDPISPRR
jgi:hydroxybutyrate-dimer hydrolase